MQRMWICENMTSKPTVTSIYFFIGSIKKGFYESHHFIPSAEIGGHGANSQAHIQITQKIVHEGEVNRARYQPDNPNIIATKARSGEVFVFDRTTHESFPKENEKCNPAIRLLGHDKEG